MQPKFLLSLVLLVAGGAVASDPQTTSTAGACVVFQTLASFDTNTLDATTSLIVNPSTKGPVASAVPPTISARALVGRQTTQNTPTASTTTVIPQPTSSNTSPGPTSTVTAVVTTVSGGWQATVYPSGVTAGQYPRCSSTTTSGSGQNGTGTAGSLSGGRTSSVSDGSKGSEMKNGVGWAAIWVLLGSLTGVVAIL